MSLSSNKEYLKEIADQIRNVSECEALKQLIEEGLSVVTDYIDSVIQEQLRILKNILPILSLPSPDPISIVKWLSKLITGTAHPQLMAYIKYTEELIEFAAALADISSAIEQAIESEVQCLLDLTVTSLFISEQIAAIDVLISDSLAKVDQTQTAMAIAIPGFPTIDVSSPEAFMASSQVTVPLITESVDTWVAEPIDTAAIVDVLTGKTFTVSNTMSFVSTDGANVDFGAGGAVMYEPGYTGSKGDTGYTGSASTVVGYTGSKGDTGYTGSQGDIGYTGSASTAVGYTGSQGDIGYTGSGAQIITSTSVNAFTVGRQGTTDPVLNVDASTASVVTGLNVKGAAAAGGVALSVTSSGTNEDIFIDPKGGGGIILCNNSTGYVEVRQTTNGLLGSYVRNNSTGTAAHALLGVVSSTGGSGELRHNGSGFTTSGIYQQNGTMLLGGAAGGLTVGTTANQPVYFAQNNAEAARIDTNKYLLLGYTTSQGAYSLQVNGKTKTTGVSTASGSTSVTSSPVTLFTVSNAGTYDVVADFGTSQGGYAQIQVNPNGGVWITWQTLQNTGIVFSISGNDVQARKGDSSAGTIYWQYSIVSAS